MNSLDNPKVLQTINGMQVSWSKHNSRPVLTLHISRDGSNDLMIQAEMLVAIRRTITTLGIHTAWRVALLGIVAFDQENVEDEVKRLSMFLSWIEHLAPADDLAEWASYYALKARVVTRAEAAEFASALLGKEVKSENWRKVTDRWAKNQGLLPVQIHKPRQPDVTKAAHPVIEQIGR